MFQAFFKIMFNLLATIVQVVLLPLNTLINSVAPDLTNYVTFFTNNVSKLFQNLTFFINIIPPITRQILGASITILIAKYSISVGSKAVTKIWNLFQKIKFW